MVVNVLFAGVGGQGVVTASDVLAEAALQAGWDAKKAETHGMAQRGGSVVSHVRIAEGERLFSPLIPEAGADFLVALELLEAVRALPMLRPEGRVIADARRIVPMTVASGAATYPEGIEERLRQRGVVVKATEEAERLGEPRAANSLLMGVLGHFLDLQDAAWHGAFEACLKPRAVEVNWQAFLLGRKLADAGGS